MDDEPRWLDDRQLHAWRNLVALLQQLPGRLEEPLQPQGLSFFEYIVMAMLSDAPDWSLRMSHLAELTSASLSRLSHTVSRLERRGWVRRRPSPEDGRVTLATLTDDGFDKLAAAAPDHVESVQQLVFDALTPAQVRQLDAILEAVLPRVGPGVPPPWALPDSTARDPLPG